MNFKNFGEDPPADAGGGGRNQGDFTLARQSSIYSLTFDEFQNTMGGIGKDFGSMNMDELLKNIWSAEETQTMTSTTSAAAQGLGTSASAAGAAASAVGGVFPGGYLQRQGSLTLPRTLSQKTVDEVWKDISKESLGAVLKDGSAGAASNMPPQAQRQPTLGEITLEEFLVRAGVVREDAQFPTNTDQVFFGNSGSGLGIGFLPQPGQNSNNSNQIQSLNLPLNVNGVRANQPKQQQQPQIFPKQAASVTYGSQLGLSNAQLGSPGGIRGGIMGISDQGLNSNLITGGGGMGMVSLGGGAVNVPTGSPANPLSSDGMGKSNGTTPSMSPVLPYLFNGGLRGRKGGGAVEKVVERRQRRMIKNRESAARSRARKQAYTMELEAEVAKLKEENEELRKKQEEIMEMQKNQAMEMEQRGPKRRCTRRTQSGPW